MSSPFQSWAGIPAIDVPFSLLLSKELTPAAKLLWMRLTLDTLHSGPRPLRAKRLVKCISVARSTIYAVLRRCTDRCAERRWFIGKRDPRTGKLRLATVRPVGDERNCARIPIDLIRASHALRPQAVVCYGLLQALPEFSPRGRAGWLRWEELRKITGLHLRTLKRAVRELVEARWVSLAQKNRQAPIFFRLQLADEAFQQELERNLNRAKYGGEGLMRAILSLIVDTTECQDNARPAFLANPGSSDPMEFDRFYPLDRVGVEFNGSQHYVPSERFSLSEVEAQRKRDRLKQRICKERGITLVIVTAEDLSVVRMLKKVRNLLPRRSLRCFRKTIRFLNDRCAAYRASSVADGTRSPFESSLIRHAGG